MQFTDSSSKTGLYEDAKFLTQTDTNAFPLADFARLANRWYYKAVIAVWKFQDSWRFDDSNQTSNNDDDAGKPVATSTLTNSQKVYALPTGALRIRRVEVKDQASNWQIVAPIAERSITGAEEEFAETDGIPRYYVLEGDKVRLFPAPDNGVSVTLTNGLRIFFDREVDEFTSADTTQEPGLPEPFHRVISLGAAYDYAIAHGLSNAKALGTEVTILMQEMGAFFSKRHDNKTTLRINPRVSIIL